MSEKYGDRSKREEEKECELKGMQGNSRERRKTEDGEKNE